MHPSLSIQSGDLLNHDRSQAIRLDLEADENSVAPVDTDKEQTEMTEVILPTNCSACYYTHLYGSSAIFWFVLLPLKLIHEI